MMASISKELVWQRQQSALMSHLNSMRHASIKTDAVLLCGKTEYPVHQNILAASSPYFNTMFECPMKDIITVKVEMKGVTPEALETVLDFLYTGDTPDLDPDTHRLKGLLEACHLLQVQTLFDYYFHEFTEALTVESFVESCKMANWYENFEILPKLAEFLAGNDKDIFAQGDFLSLKLAEWKCVHPLLKLEQVPTDTAVRGILAWTNHHVGERKGFLEELISVYDVHSLSSDYINELITDETLITANQNVFGKLVSVAFSRLRSGEKGKVQQQLKKCTTPQPPVAHDDPHDRTLYFALNSYGVTTMNAFSVLYKVWTLSDVKVPFNFEAGTICVKYLEKLYMITGLEDDTIIYEYSPESNMVSVFGKLNHSAHQAGACVFNGKIYVVGGKPDYRTFQCFDMESKECATLAATEMPHINVCVFEHKGEIYVCDYTVKDGTPTKQGNLEKYSTVSNKWTVVTAYDTPSLLPVLHDGTLVVPLTTGLKFLQYDLATDVWATKELPCVSCDSFYYIGMGSVEDVLLLFGVSVPDKNGGACAAEGVSIQQLREVVGRYSIVSFCLYYYDKSLTTWTKQVLKNFDVLETQCIFLF